MCDEAAGAAEETVGWNLAQNIIGDQRRRVLDFFFVEYAHAFGHAAQSLFAARCRNTDFFGTSQWFQTNFHGRRRQRSKIDDQGLGSKPGSFNLHIVRGSSETLYLEFPGSGLSRFLKTSLLLCHRHAGTADWQ